jgi:hypothetical protein
VLGPRPPPWRKHKFYRILTIFNDFGAFNRAGKTVSKIGIYALPPLKSEIYTPFIVRGSIYQHFINSRPITELFALKFGIWYCMLLFHFLVLSRSGYFSFSGVLWFSWCRECFVFFPRKSIELCQWPTATRSAQGA